MKRTTVVMGLLIFYAIIQGQLPCNFSITCLAGMPTLHQELVDRWTGKPKPVPPIVIPNFFPPKRGAK
jgi:hypothetical protein